MTRILAMVLVLMCLISAVAITSEEIQAQCDPYMDWFSAGEGEKAELPEGLSEREAEIYRIAYARGHYAALHPAYQDGVYLLNQKTKKFHRTDCRSAISISASDRAFSTLSREELMAQGYDPCGGCRP